MSAIRDFRRRTFASLSIRNYRIYVLAQAVSMCGSWMQSIAQALLVLRLTDSGTALGLVIALQSLPILILGPWGGVFVDRLPKRQLLYVTQTTAGLLALTLGILVIGDWIQLWMVFIAALCTGMNNVFNQPTVQTFVREMVGKEHLANAVSLNATEMNLARAIGPTIAGILVSTVGIGACFIVDGLSYGVVIFALSRMRMSELQPAPRIAAAKGQLMAGLSYVRRTPALFNLMIMMTLVGMLTYEFAVILPLLSEFTFNTGSTGFAALNAAMGAGSVVGGLVAAGNRHGTMRRVSFAALGFGIAMLLVAGSPTIYVAVACMLIVGFFSINFSAMTNVSMQLGSRPDMQGRVMALYAVAFIGTTPIGGPIQGWIGEHAGARWSLVVGGMAAVTAAAIGFFNIRRSERQEAAALPPL
jgi:MFS family permease